MGALAQRGAPSKVMIRKTNISRIVFILLAVAYVCKAETASGQIFLGAGPEALGQAGRANNNGMDAHFLNPAGVAFSRGTNIGGVFQEGDLSQATPVNNYAFEIIDNDPESPLSGGLAYAYKRSSFSDHTLYDQDLSLSMAGHILPNVAFGIQGHRLFRQNSNGPAYTKYNTTVGLLAIPANWFGLALVGYDILGDADQVLIPTFAVGLNFIIMDILRIRFDATRPELQNPNHAAIMGGGTEFNLGYDVFLRAGGEWNNITTQTYFTAGLGFEGPKLNVGYAYRTNVNVDGDAFHTFQVWLTF